MAGAARLHRGIEPDWPAPAHVRALTTLRGADAAQVLALRFPGMRVCEMRQVHGTVCVDAATCEPGSEADACCTRQALVACRVLSADCLPILLSSLRGDEVAAIHAGWRGLAAGVVEQTLARMRTAAAQLMAWLGPAICREHYPVGAEVRAAFLERSPPELRGRVAAAFAPRAGAYLADLAALARIRLERAGCARIYGGRLCTFADAGRFYSWRRERCAGRMHSLIAIAGQPPG